MRAPITAPPAQQARYSLLVAAGANGATGEEDRWGRGVSWQPETCGGGGISPANNSLTATDVAARVPSERTSQTFADPFYVWATDEDTTQGHSARDWQARARRALEATQSAQIATELWAGAHTLEQLSAGDVDAASPFLADTSRVVDEQLAASRAIGVAEALALECAGGRRLMLHVPVAVLEAAMRGGPGYVARDSGGVLTTPMGSIVVADAGYPGTGPIGPDVENPTSPDNSVQWIYTSQLVQVRLGQVELLPGSLADARDLAQALNRGTNDLTVWAQRLALYQLDPCCRIAVSTDVPALPTITTLTAP